jgi:hypothetical protein
MGINRTRTPADLVLLATSVLAGPVAIGVVVVLALSTADACSTEETTPAIDAGIPPCKTGPVIFCQPIQSGPGCFTDDNSSELLLRLPRATLYPVGCTVNFVGPRDEQGDCRIDGVCKCLVSELPTDADAAPAGDAAPPPAPTGPRWNCAP